MVACGRNNDPSPDVELSDVISVTIAGQTETMPNAQFFTWSAVQTTALAELTPATARPLAYAGPFVAFPTLDVTEFSAATLALLTPALTASRLDAIQGANDTVHNVSGSVAAFTTAWNALVTAVTARNTHHTSSFGQTDWTLVAPTQNTGNTEVTFNGATVAAEETNAAFLTRVQTHNDRLAVRRSHEVAIAEAWATLNAIVVPTGTVSATSVRPTVPATATTGALAAIAAGTPVAEANTFVALTAYNTTYLTSAYTTLVADPAGDAALARAQVEGAVSTVITTAELASLRAFFAEVQGYNALVAERDARVRTANVAIAGWNAQWATGTVAGYMMVEGEPVWTSASDMEIGTALQTLLTSRVAPIVAYFTDSQTTVPALTAEGAVGTRVRNTVAAAGVTDAALAGIVNNTLLTTEERTAALVAAQLPLANQANFVLAEEVADLVLRSRTVGQIATSNNTVRVYGNDRIVMEYNAPSATFTTVASLFAFEDAITPARFRSVVEFSVIAEAIRPDWLPHPPVVEEMQRVYIDGDLVAIRIPLVGGGSLIDAIAPFNAEIIIVVDARGEALLIV